MHGDDFSLPPEEALEESGAFLVVRLAETTEVVDLPRGDALTVGRSPDADLALDHRDVAGLHCMISWDGEAAQVRRAGRNIVHVNGKKITHAQPLEAGDEITVGPARLVIGIAASLEAGGRRTLTHHEFCERLSEELARAARGNRHTSLVMVRAKSGEGGRVATAALESFRAGDVVATFASDEIELLLPDTDAGTAETVVGRILRTLDIEPMVGLAVAPGDGDTSERMIRAARLALHEAMRAEGGFRRPPAKENGDLEEPVIRDESTRRVIEEVARLAANDRAVLITGESSTGKSLFARMIHDRSARSQGPVITIHCPGIVETDEVDDAFGTAEDPGGRVVEAVDGSLLLDEVGDLDPDAQARLVAALDAVGDEVRVLATTQRALAGLVERGAFRPELQKRIAEETLELPSLRARREDIFPLAIQFAEEAGAHKPVRLSPAAIARLRSYPWPGNVLELRNAMERAVCLAGEAEILGEHLPSEPVAAASSRGRLREHVDGVERDAIVKALADSNYNQTHAARRLGISRRALIYKMEKYGLKPPPASGRR